MDPKPERSSSVATDETPLETLLQRPAALPERVDGILVGHVDKITPDGSPCVAIEAFGLAGVLAASLTPIAEEHIGKKVALGFEAGNPRRPIILGLMFEPAQWEAASSDPASLNVTHEDGRCVVSAEDELELRCGEALIRLRADGRIYLRGQYITSHADVGQRIRGGSVQIN
ncbi:MAG: DUF6484 domain-containing protein [Betaproteobacteria bacterium]|nr:DUF6484 domain-containing protein [Betaproteobacteria bacterium]